MEIIFLYLFFTGCVYTAWLWDLKDPFWLKFLNILSSDKMKKRLDEKVEQTASCHEIEKILVEFIAHVSPSSASGNPPKISSARFSPSWKPSL